MSRATTELTPPAPVTHHVVPGHDTDIGSPWNPIAIF